MTLTADIVVEKQKKFGWTGARGRLKYYINAVLRFLKLARINRAGDLDEIEWLLA